MSLLSDLLAAEGIVDEEDVEWLHVLVGDWQLIADLSFADLVLWVPVGDEARRAQGASEEDFRIIAHCRPTTGSTVYPHDEVGSISSVEEREFLHTAMSEKRIVISPETSTPLSGAEAVPVVRAGRVVALLTRHTEESRRTGTSRLERYYRSCASMLLSMIAEGEFPDLSAPSGARRGEPRVGDGLIVLNREGRVRYASPNGVSVLHRLGHEGEIEGRYLAEVVSGLIEQLRPVDETLPLVLTGRAPWRTEVESGRVSVSLRAIPIKRAGNRTGAIILARDVSEVRRRDRELLSRDAMIREMHHRVKNNLQTVSALLRLQTRRMSSPEARDALQEAMRRVSIIAVVHDVLSQGIESEVDFDEVVDKGLRLTRELASPQVRVTLSRNGSFGPISSGDATGLAMALMELVTNAIEHGFPVTSEPQAPGETVLGIVTVTPERDDDRLRVTIADDGVGLQPGEGPGAGLGTQIVQSLIANDLGGSIQWRPREGGGTEAVIDVPLRSDRL
ncbi:histidine kinase N-terminal domain-containing protein [Brevibacterium daeguense]|uniref:histidine kinase n=1 Tax=Brevibacterium daeguense TaxID=909936 RepID=A0ABP8EML0_9MICO|nr:PAS domain-containing sensor histidine kinase [Brevibacterium daeguense]